jgi:uncharacterized protein YkwD
MSSRYGKVTLAVLTIGSVPALLNAGAEPARANPGLTIPCGPTCQSVSTGAQATLGLINRQRAQNGCGPVVSDDRLAAAAQEHARDILNTGITGHVGSDGSNPDQRIADAGYTPMRAWGEIQYEAENDFTSPQAAVDAWMASPGHHAIIVNCSYVDLGLAAVSSGSTVVYVGDFATH